MTKEGQRKRSVVNRLTKKSGNPKTARYYLNVKLKEHDSFHARNGQRNIVPPHVIRDARCFLENGATAAHLFVGEDLPVGDTVGVLGVLGDPGPQGDIELRLQELDSPVTFSAYSKNLTLIRPLDKEGVDGPASVYVNVICERKHTLDPGFVIPVNIRVTDANDNAPQFVNAPYVLNISENDTSRVNVSVEDVNEWEPRFRHPRYEFHAATSREGSIVGKLEAADGDRDDKISLSLRGPDARSFEIRDNGELILRSVATVNGSLARLVAVASDSGRPPRLHISNRQVK
ncbi:Protocadherin wing polarity protein stan [Apis mellifera caucasica]|nr:Protocadherin wing polarity protein stan [Apis mellifera caucasica]